MTSSKTTTSGQTKTTSLSSTASSSSSSSYPNQGRPGRGLSFTSSPPKQRRLTFEPAPREPVKKKVRIEEPALSRKGKGRAVGGDIQGHEASDERQQQKGDLWSTACGPSSRSELAVHPRKIKDVEAWLRDALDGSLPLKRLRRLLILTGPTGSAKTETIRRLSCPSELDFDIIEWKSDTMARSGESFASGDDFASFKSRFREFFSRSTKFRKLSLTEQEPVEKDLSSSVAGSSQWSSSVATSMCSRRLILLEDLPNLSHPGTLEYFQEMMATQLSSPLYAGGDHTPICVILSDVSGTSGGLLEDGSTNDDQLRRDTEWMRPRRLLGEELTSNDSWVEIKFNPVAPTLIKKALKATLEKVGVVDKSNKRGSRQKVAAGKDFPLELVDVIVEVSNGDIRSAVNTLQHVYATFQSKLSKFSTLNKVKNKTSDKDTKRAARDLLQSSGVFGRDSSLDLFHALGRILWNKRVGDAGDVAEVGDGVAADAMDPLPQHLQPLERRQSRVDVKGMAVSSVDTSMLQLFSHHNFPSFCNQIEECESILDAFSFANSQLKVRDLGSGASDEYATLPLSEHYSFLVTTHATLLHLPSPVERRGQRPSKPTFFEATTRLKAQRETLEDVKRGMRWDLRSSKEVQEELVPLVGKIIGGKISDPRMGGKTLMLDPAGKTRSDLIALASFDFSVYQEGQRAASASESKKRPLWARTRQGEEEFASGLDDVGSGMDVSMPEGNSFAAVELSSDLYHMREVERDEYGAVDMEGGSVQRDQLGKRGDDDEEEVDEGGEDQDEIEDYGEDPSAAVKV